MADTKYIYTVTVVSTNPEHRTVKVQIHGTERYLEDVIVITDSGSFSFPSVGDFGLVIGDDVRSYFIGKIEFGYKDKIDGKLRDKSTGAKILAKLVNDGEIYIGNLIKRCWLSISSGGDFSLLNGLNEGIKYFRSLRFLRLASMFIHLLGNGVNVYFGSVARDIPGAGKTVIPSDAGPTIPAIEAFIDLFIEPLKTRLARFHIGHIKNSLGVDEFGSLGGRLRGILEVCNQAGVTIASLKMDEVGNIELTALPPGKLVLDGSPESGILLGGLGAVQSAAFGDLLINWLLNHTHSTPVGPSGVPIQVPGFSTTLSELLSKKVKIG